MILERFRKRLSEYGYKRLLTSTDIVTAVYLTLILFNVDKISCWISEFPHIKFVNFGFISNLIPVLGSLTSFIITGLAVLASLTDEDFLAELSDLEVYENILFMFEYNILLLAWTTLLATILTSYKTPDIFFYMFVFFLSYSLLSLTELMQLITNIGINKARHEEKKLDKE